MRLIKLGLTLTAIATLVACGGGGTSTTSSTTGSTGTVAVGAPLSGATVTYMDANGTSLTATTSEDGTYSIQDLSTLTTPIMIRAVGSVNGKETSLYSVITTKPTAGFATVANVTPLTNSIVSQVAAGESEYIFNNPSNISALTASEINSASTKLLTVLEAPMSGLGVSGLDPFKTAFTANSTGVDKLLDLVRIDPDPFGRILVTDKISGVTKVIASTDSSQAVTANKLANAPDSVTSLDFTKVQTLIDKFNTVLAKGNSISSSDITSLAVPTGFLHKGENLSTWIQGIVSEPPPAGYKIGKYTIESCNPTTKVCSGGATLVDENGNPSEKFDMPLKWNNGAWYFYGDQFEFDFDFQPVISIEIPTDQTTYESATVKFGFWIGQDSIEKSISSSSYDKIKISFSNDSGTTFYPTWSLIKKVGCEFFTEINSAATGGCSNFLDSAFVPSTSLTNFASAKSSFFEGTLRVKVEVISGNITLKSNTFTPRFKAYSEEDVAQIARKTVKLIKFNELGTTSVTLLPRVHFVSTQLRSSTDNSYISSVRVYGEQKLRSGTKVTVSQICAMTSDSGCSTPHTEKIWTIFQNLRPEADPNAMIWIDYRKTPQ